MKTIISFSNIFRLRLILLIQILCSMNEFNFFYRFRGYVLGHCVFDVISRTRFSISYMAQRYGLSPDCVTRSMPFLLGYCQYEV